MIISHKLPNTAVHLIGKQPRSAFVVPEELSVPETRCHLRVASDARKEGFRQIVPWQETTPKAPILADGVILRKAGQSTIFHTADCPTVILDSPTQTITIHAGRPAMTPDTQGRNIIDDALTLIDDPTQTHVYITGTISGQHFQHDHPGKRGQAQPFLETYGPEAFTNLETYSLDLVALIKYQLAQTGVPDTQVIHDGFCTYKTQELASHRRDGSQRTTSNLIIVTR